MNIRLTIILLFFFGVAFSNNPQSRKEGYYRYTIVNGDTVPIVDLPVCVITNDKESYSLNSKRDIKRYTKLNRYVRKVYPYAELAASKLKECEGELMAAKDEKARKKIMKKVEKAIKDKYGKELKNLTVTQGKILLKLIDRQVGVTSFELLQELRGNFSASMWQGLAVIFGHNLKMEYDAVGDDWMIEEIVRKIEMGY